MTTTSQFGTAVESTYGTPVTIDRFHEIQEGESLERRQEVIATSGIRPGLYSGLGARRSLVRRWGEGGVGFEVMSTGFGRILEHMLGGTGSVAQQAATAAYLQTFTPGSLLGKSLTMQKGVQKVDGTAQAFTYHGVKLPEWEFSIDVDGFLILALRVDAEDVDDTTALAAASYGTLSPLSFAQGTLKRDGGAALAGVSNVRVRGRTALDTDRFFLGTAGLKSEPLENGLRELGGALSMEFAAVTDMHDAFEADTSMSLELEFVGDVIEGAYSEQLTITLADVRLTGETPKVEAAGPTVTNIPYEGFEDGSGDSVTIEYLTTDTAV